MTRPTPPLDRVGIVMLSTVGNAVHALPLLNAIKRHRPGSHIGWITQRGPASLVRGHPAVDEIIPFERRGGWRSILDLRNRLAERPFDVVLVLQVYFKAGLVAALTRAPVRLGFDRRRTKDQSWIFTTHRIPPRPPRHTQDQFFEFLDYLDVPYGEPEWKLGPWPDERPRQQAFFDRIDRPAVSLVLAGSREETSWVPERWAALVDTLYHDYGFQPILAGGRSNRELEIERVIHERSRHRPVSTLGVPLRELVGILDGSALVISPDTGPLHMAVALDRPLISLLGYYHPGRMGPFRRFHDLIIDAHHDPGEITPISDARRPGRTRRITLDQVREKVDLAVARYLGPAPPGQGCST